jgi:hypothetical protein
MGTVPTVKIKAPDGSGSFWIINESDFDSALYEIWAEPSEAAPVAPNKQPSKDK